MPNDPFAAVADTPAAPARAPFAITPNDSAALPQVTKAIYVGTSGHVVVRAVGAAADVTFRNVPAGATIDVRAEFVRATGTSASDIVGLA